MNIIQYNGKHYVFYNLRNESEMMFQERTWIIVKNIHKFASLSDLEALSFIWINHKFLGVTYDEDIMERLKTLNSVYEDIS